MQLKAYREKQNHFLMKSICVFEQILYKEQLAESQLKSKMKTKRLNLLHMPFIKLSFLLLQVIIYII